MSEKAGSLLISMRDIVASVESIFCGFVAEAGERLAESNRSSHSLKAMVATFAALGIFLALATALSALDHSILKAPRQFIASWWGIAVLLNLAFSRLFMACWVYVMERQTRRAIRW